MRRVVAIGCAAVVSFGIGMTTGRTLEPQAVTKHVVIERPQPLAAAPPVATATPPVVLPSTPAPTPALRPAGARLLEELKRSTVLLQVDDQPICNARLRLIGDDVVVVGAAHCILNWEGLEHPLREQVAKGLEITDKLTANFVIAHPETREILARLDRVAAAARNKDLFVATTADEQPGFWSRRPAGVEDRPTVGEEVVVWGGSDGTKHKPFEARGIDLGILTYSHWFEEEEEGVTFDLRMIGFKEADVEIGPGMSGNQPSSATGDYGPEAWWHGKGNEESSFPGEIVSQRGVDLKKKGIRSVMMCVDLDASDYFGVARTLGVGEG